MASNLPSKEKNSIGGWNVQEDTRSIGTPASKGFELKPGVNHGCVGKGWSDQSPTPNEDYPSTDGSDSE